MLKLPAPPKYVIPPGIGGKVDLRQRMKSEKEQVQLLMDKLDAIITEIEDALYEQMVKEETTKGGGSLATVSITSNVVPVVKDWDAFYRYIKRTNYFHLLERRPTVSGCRELFETKGAIPGVEPFTKYRLNFTATKG